MKPTRRTCPQGHTYRKSSDCPICPHCEAARKPQSGFLASLGAPVRRALEGAGLITLKKLSARTEQDILSLHGIGPSSLFKLRAALKAAGLAFKS